MENPILADNENIPLVTHHSTDRDDNKDFGDYNTGNTCRVDQTSSITPSLQDNRPTSLLRLRQRVKGDKLATLYRHLNVTGDLDLVDTDCFKLKKKSQKQTTLCYVLSKRLKRNK